LFAPADKESHKVQHSSPDKANEEKGKSLIEEEKESNCIQG